MGGLIQGNFDEVRSTFGLVAVPDFIVAMRTRASGLMNICIIICTVRLYFVQLAVTSRYKIHYCMFKNIRWIKIVHQRSSSQINFPSAQIILPSQLEILAKITEFRMNINKDLRITSSNCTRVAAETIRHIRSSGTQPTTTPEVSGVRYWASRSEYRSVHSCTLLRGPQMAINQ